MPVLTRREYLARGASKKKNSGKGDKVVPPPVSEVLEKNPLMVHVLHHPEIKLNGGPNFSETVEIDGEKTEKVCVDGVVKTLNAGLAARLVSEGYIRLDTREYENGED